MSIHLEEVSTFLLVLIGCVQAFILKRQTKMQEQAVKIALLENRMECLSVINEVRSMVKNSDTNIGFLNGYLGCFSQEDSIRYLDALNSRFLIASMNAKHLFSEEISQKLLVFSGFLRNFNFGVKRYFADMRMLNEKAQSGDISAQRSMANLAEKSFKMLNVESSTERELLILSGFSENHPYLIALNKLKDVFSDETFFEKLLPYVDVHNIARV